MIARESRWLLLICTLALAAHVGCAGDGSEVDARAGTDGDGGAVDADSGDGGADGGGSGDVDGGAEPFWADTHIDYAGAGVDESVDLDGCYFCDASDSGDYTLLRYQQGDGYTIWALYIPDGTTVGTHALSLDYSGYYATLSANDTSLPDAAQGFYLGNSNVGSVTLTRLEVYSGGSIDGTIDVVWTKGEVTAHMVSTFHAELP